MDLPPVPYEMFISYTYSRSCISALAGGRHFHGRKETYIAPREIPTLEHEPGDNAVKATVLVAKPLLARAQSAEVFSGSWYVLGVEFENDSSRWACAGHDIRATIMGWLKGHGWK